MKRGWNDKGKVWIVSGFIYLFFFDRSKIFLKPSYSSSRANTRGCDSTRFLSSFSRCYGSLNPAAWSVNLYIFNTCYVSRNCFRVNRLIDFARAVTIVTRWRVDLYNDVSTINISICWMHQTFESFLDLLEIGEKIICRFQKKKKKKKMFRRNCDNYLYSDFFLL